MAADISWVRCDRISVAILRGHIGSTNAQRVLTMLGAGVSPNDTALVLDLEKLTFISSAGLRILLVLAKQHRRKGKSFSVCTPSNAIRDILQSTGIDRILTIHEKRAQALAAAGAQEEAKQQEAPAKTELVVRGAVDFGIVEENILAIADFAIEQYELSSSELSNEIKDEAIAEIKNALWRRVEELKRKRVKFLQGMVSAAERTLEEVVAKSR